MSGPAAGGPELRHATEADHRAIVDGIDDWFAGRRVRHLLARAWFRHFGSTSWVATRSEGAPIGFLVGLLSPDRADEAVIHLLAVHPAHRRRGIGRRLVDAFGADAERGGRHLLTANGWADDPAAAAFFRAVGFRADDGPGSRNLYGRPAFPDYDGDGEDRTVFVRRLTPAR
jgi:GNAT superfamily N-acetyltransferase